MASKVYFIDMRATIKENFIAKNRNKYHVEITKIKLTKFIKIYSSSEIRNDYESYPELASKLGDMILLKNLFYFSRIGFNKDKSKALLHMGFVSGSLSGHSKYIYLVKNSKNEWEIFNSYVTGVS